MEYPKVCKECNKEFIAGRNDAKFCSSICKSRYSNEQTRKKKKEQDQGAATLQDVMNQLQEIKTLLTAQSERIMSVDDVCKELTISKQTFERLVADGFIQLHRFGKVSEKGRSKKPFVLFSEIVATLKNG